MKEVVKKEIIKWLDARIIYSDSDCVSPVHCVSKKRGMTVVENTKNELIPTRTVTGWKIFMNYRKFNKATKNDHLPLSFIHQISSSKITNSFVIPKHTLSLIYCGNFKNFI